MRILVATLIGFFAFVATYSVFRPEIIADGFRKISFDPVQATTFCVNIAVLFLTLLSVWIALAAYRSAESTGKDQHDLLVGARRALESSVELSNNHLLLVKQQWDSEQERLSRKPQVEILLENLPADQLLTEPTVTIQPTNGTQTLIFLIKNVGNASLLKPLIIISASPDAVFVDSRGMRIQRPNNNVLQIGGSNVMDLVPFEINQSPYRFEADLTIPQNVKNLDVQFLVYGENLSKQTRLVHLVVQDSPTPKPAG